MQIARKVSFVFCQEPSLFLSILLTFSYCGHVNSIPVRWERIIRARVPLLLVHKRSRTFYCMQIHVVVWIFFFFSSCCRWTVESIKVRPRRDTAALLGYGHTAFEWPNRLSRPFLDRKSKTGIPAQTTVTAAEAVNFRIVVITDQTLKSPIII